LVGHAIRDIAWTRVSPNWRRFFLVLESGATFEMTPEGVVPAPLPADARSAIQDDSDLGEAAGGPRIRSVWINHDDEVIVILDSGKLINLCTHFNGEEVWNQVLLVTTPADWNKEAERLGAWVLQEE